MTTTDQGHMPANSPGGTGGQFTGVIHSNPEAILPSEVHGSFLFPPTNYGDNGIQSYIEFWESAPISDRVLSNVISTYKQNREMWIGEQLDAWSRRRDEDGEHMAWVAARKTTEADVIAENESSRAIELERLKAERPIEFIQSNQVRGIAVAAQMYFNSGSFNQDEQKVVDEHPIQLSRGSEPQAVADIFKTYHLEEIINVAFVDQDVAVQYQLAELRKHMGAFTVND